MPRSRATPDRRLCRRKSCWPSLAGSSVLSGCGNFALIRAIRSAFASWDGLVLQSEGRFLIPHSRQVENLPHEALIQVKRGLQCPALLVVECLMQQEN